MGQPIDYNALAAQSGAISSTPPPSAQPTQPAQPGQSVDYNALAAQHGAVNSTPPPTQAPDDYLSKTENFLGDAATGVAKGAGDLWGMVKGIPSGIYHSIPPVALADSVKQALPILNAYEKSRSSGKGVMDSLSDANNQAANQDRVGQLIQQRVADFKKNPTQETVRALVDTAGVLGTVYATHGIGAEADAGALDAATAGTEDTEAATGAETSPEPSTTPDSPTAPSGPADTSSASPADTVAANNAAKSGLPQGTEAQTEPPTIQNVQPDVQQGLRDTVNNVASEEGLSEVPEETSVRDLGKNLGDQFYARSKATFAKVQEVTGVDLDDLSNKISTLSDKIEDAIDNPEKAGQLEQQKLSLENRAGEAFDKAKASGLDVDQAKIDWKKYNASYDFGKQVRVSTDGRAGIGSGEIVDPSKLAPRLQKMADSNSPTQPGRLQQFMGDENTNSLLNKMEENRGTIRDFEPSSATGQKAMQDLIRPNTGAGNIQAIKQSLGFSPKTNWIKTYGDFNKLGPEEIASRFGADAPQAKSYLASQARLQVAKMLGTGLGAAAIAKLTGLSGSAVHLLMD